VRRVLSNPDITDGEPRTHLYRRQNLLYPPPPRFVALVEHACNPTAEASTSEDPQGAHYDTLAEGFALQKSQYDGVSPRTRVQAGTGEDQDRDGELLVYIADRTDQHHECDRYANYASWHRVVEGLAA
jgi:hypothetical protein